MKKPAMIETGDPQFDGILANVEKAIQKHFVSERYREMLRVRDQLEGDARALSELYHPDPPGLTEEQLKKVKQARTHVNLVQPALERLVNSIHAGKIKRKVTNSPAAQEWVKESLYQESMVCLCESAFSMGTAYMMPLLNDVGEVDFWFPNPLNTMLVVDRFNVRKVKGIIEIITGGLGFQPLGYRVLTGEVDATHDGETGETVVNYHGLGFLPLVIAYGRPRHHYGEAYGKTLVRSAADASIKVTNNELNLELLRDLNTQSLLVIQGEPLSTSKDNKESLQKYILFDKEGGDARYETPDSVLSEIIKLTQRFATDAAVSSGLPLDTFLPELITGSDASATAARNRAFPLAQRMTRLVDQWKQVEIQAAAILAALEENYRTKNPVNLNQKKKEAGIEIKITPSLPEAESETLSNWIQKIVNYLAPIEDAVDFYNEEADPEVKAALVEAWKRKNAGEEQTATVLEPLE